mmetsp:Transcript_23971/g.40772  ORF Transcript_23971/g.40772 Transcript_23971/m.40772 type:complete len:739 (+) Transcript_23971:75-2291(+)
MNSWFLTLVLLCALAGALVDGASNLRAGSVALAQKNHAQGAHAKSQSSLQKAMRNDDDDDDDDDDGSDEDDSEEESDEGYSDDSNESNELDDLVDKLPAHLRQKVIMKKGEGGDDSDSDDSEDEEGDETSGWGKKKNFWSADTADLEIGQDVQDAEDEEEAAKALRREQLAKQKDSDYMDAFEDDEVIDDVAAKKSNKLTAELELLSTASGQSKNVSIEKLNREVSKLSKSQRLDIIRLEAPEMLGLVDELNERVLELRNRIVPVADCIEKASKLKPVDDDLAKYLEVKQQLLLSYCINTVFYLILKAEGKSVKSHPVMKQLLTLRYAMEKMRPLDGRLKHQIDRLLSVQINGDQIEEPESNGMKTKSHTNNKLRPNAKAMLEGDSDEDSDESSGASDDDMNRGGRNASANGIYRPRKLNAVHYNDEKDITRQEEKLERKRKKLKNSEILESLREEFGDAPEAAASSGIDLSADKKALEEEEAERRNFEEDRFVRLTMSRKDKQSIKKREKMLTNYNNMADIGDVGEFEELADLANAVRESNGQSSQPAKSIKSSHDNGDINSAMRKAVSVFSGDSGSKISKKSMNMEGWSDEDEDNEFDDMLAMGSGDRKRRRAPDEAMDDEDDEENLVEAFGKKKKEFVKQKKEHYTIPSRTGGHDDTVSGDKRAASYEIMTNRGLTPHRKKANRNPRVKKREAFAKAVVARKGQVREAQAGSSTNYGGELTGIKANLSRSRKIGT